MNKDKEYYEGLDKRTKEYKEYAKFNRVGNETQSFNIPVSKENSKLNIPEEIIKELNYKILYEEIPTKKPKQILRPFNRLQFQVYGMYRDVRTLNVWNADDIDLLVSLYAHAFAVQYDSADLTKESKGSFKKLSKMSKELDIVYETYKRDLSDLKTK